MPYNIFLSSDSLMNHVLITLTSQHSAVSMANHLVVEKPVPVGKKNYATE
jgi:hypothetical protein